MAKPISLVEHFQVEIGKRLIKEAQPKPRRYFRASELGNCALAIWYDMMGYRPRPSDIAGKMIGLAGEAAHDAVRKAFGEVFWIDQIEAVEEGRNSLVFFETFEGTELEFHVRPDGVIKGEIIGAETDGDTGYVEEWPDGDHVLLEVKSTTPYAMKAARSAPGMMWPSWVYQCQIAMHFMNLREALLLQVERSFYDMNGDQKILGFSRIPYSERVVEEIFIKCKEILGCVETGEAPPPGCNGSKGMNKVLLDQEFNPMILKDKQKFTFNGCKHNNALVGGHTSQAQCIGGS